VTTSAVGALWDEAVQKVAERLAPARARIAPAAEAALLGRIRAGDDRACELLVHDAAGQLLATARRLLRCEQDALDVVRETFSAAFGSVGGVPVACGLAGGLHQLLIHTALSKVRQAAVHRRRVAEPFSPALTPVVVTSLPSKTGCHAPPRRTQVWWPSASGPR